MRKARWTRGEKLTFWAGVIAIITIVATFFVPDVRRLLHLEKPAQTAQLPASEGPPPTPTVAVPKLESPQIGNGTAQTTKGTRAHGKNNVAGNNISGNNNATGNNNSTAPIAIAPNGIAITGGTVSNPTVNNYNPTPAPRRLSDGQKTELATCLRTNTGSFTVGALANNGEAYRYALDFSEVLSAATWKNEWPAPVATFLIGGGMWSGFKLSVPGTWDETTQHATLGEGSPEVTLLNCLNQAKIGGAAVPYKEMKPGSIRIDISDHP